MVQIQITHQFADSCRRVAQYNPEDRNRLQNVSRHYRLHSLRKVQYMDRNTSDWVNKLCLLDSLHLSRILVYSQRKGLQNSPCYKYKLRLHFFLRI
jgi:hypothetical protein